MSPSSNARERLIQTFRFLKELNEVRNPVPRDLSGADILRLDSWPVHPCVQVRRGDYEESRIEATIETVAEPVIRIQRASLTMCPNPPEILAEWLKPGWKTVDAEVEVLESRNIEDKDNQTVTLHFSDGAERVEALNLWTTAREQWSTAERPAIAARQLFERIHALWTMMQREGDRVELVLADGMLSVREHSIKHPVLMQRVNLEFDPSVPEFRFNTGAEKIELHRTLLRLVPSIEGRMIAHFDRELEQQLVEPLGGVSAEGFFQRLVQGLFNDGEFLDDKPRGETPKLPCIWREPVIVLRPRTAGLSTTLDFIVQDLENEETQVPEGLSRIVGVAGVDARAMRGDGGAGEVLPSVVGRDPDILFSKPANAEQYEIAARLAKAKAVLVQGPPGTGKTHTIANLLGYLLSQGKTVLVTAHTTKALRVLRRQVDEALKPLCLSVLEGDADGHAQLSRASQEIADRLSRSDAASLRREAGLLRSNRAKLLGVAAALRRQLRDARFSEVEEIVLGGEGLSPIETAKRLKANAARDGWVPGPIHHGLLCPLTDAEVGQIYATQGILSPADEVQLGVSQPALAALVVPANFQLLALEQAGTNSLAQAHRPELWDETATAKATAMQLQDLHQRVRMAVSTLAEEQKWLREVLFAGWIGGDMREAWRDLLGIIETLASDAASAHRLIMAHGPVLPAGLPVDETLAILGEMIAFLEAGGSLGFKTKLTRRGWHHLIEACQVEGRTPSTMEEFRALRAMAHVAESRKRFALRWRRAVESLDGPQFDSLGQWPERAAQGFAAEIRTRLEWRTTVWEPLINELCAIGFRWHVWLAEHPPVPGDHGELARVERAGSLGLAQVIEAQAALLRQTELSAALQSQRTYLAGFPQSDAASVLLQAQNTWDVENYEEACRELARLEGLRDAYNTRTSLLGKLEAAAPEWVRMIVQRQSPHNASQPPGDAMMAWRWRQWLQELERRAAVSMADLQAQLDQTEAELRQVAAEIIEHETWAAQRERTGLTEQQSLMGFVKTLAKVTKSRRGVRDVELMREARRLLAEARRAVPVWIMPLNRVYESFDPRDKPVGKSSVFDVVVIDEASQSDVTALAALYLGCEAVVVGDDQQVTPDAVGQAVSSVQRLISTDLQGIPNSHLYDGQTSIYDLAAMAFGGVIALREHFRCVPEIIQFSNHLSYDNVIRPLREPLSASVRPALVPHRVNGFRDQRGKVNEVEAEEIASLVIACLGTPEYAQNELGEPTSIGVISLLGDEQALLIENQIRTRLAPELFERHRLLCGNAAQFQGDERDVVFLSMVDGPPEEGQLSLRDAGAKDIYKKRYNVAVSRARNQLWVVYSLDPENHLKNGDLRRRLIEHARDPQSLMRAMEAQSNLTDSPFEMLVLQRLVSAGYRVQPQWPVGAYRIDLVIEGTTRRLAVECDGERWHTPEQLNRDLERQAILERLGWIFVRIRGSVFFRDPDTAMAPLFARLDQLGIEPLGNIEPVESESTHPLVNNIRKAAEQIRQDWRNHQTDPPLGDEGEYKRRSRSYSSRDREGSR